MKATDYLSKKKTCMLTYLAHFVWNSKMWMQNNGPPGKVSILISTPVNVFGTWQCVTEAMKIFRKQGYGRLLVNSSILGFAAMPMRGAYNSSKFALEGMCDTLRHEVYGTEIYVSLVEPGPVTSRFSEHALNKFKQNIDIENSVHRVAYQNHLARLAGQTKPTPFTVSAAACAEICARAFTDTVPKPRYRVTVPTQVFWWLRKFLPTSVLDVLKRRAFAAEKR